MSGSTDTTDFVPVRSSTDSDDEEEMKGEENSKSDSSIPNPSTLSSSLSSSAANISHSNDQQRDKNTSSNNHHAELLVDSDDDDDDDDVDVDFKIAGHVLPLPPAIKSIVNQKQFPWILSLVLFLLLLSLSFAYLAGSRGNKSSASLLPVLPSSFSSHILPHNNDGLLTSLLSPGLSWCDSNPFLDRNQMPDIEMLEVQWTNWWENEMHRTVAHFDKYTNLESTGKLQRDNFQGKNDAEIFAEFQNLAFPHSLPMPCSTNLTRYGDTYDTSKFLCNLKSLEEWSAKTGEPCHIYSLGSNNLFDFELRILENTTTCTVTTCDCTSSPPNPPFPSHLNTRHSFLPYCLGSEEKSATDRNRNGKWLPLSKVLREQNHTQLHLLKMDIDYGEYDVYSELLSIDLTGNTVSEIEGLKLPSKTLPWQISFETHFWHQLFNAPKTLAMFSSLWRAGYRFMYSESNWWHYSAAEWVIIRTFC